MASSSGGPAPGRSYGYPTRQRLCRRSGPQRHSLTLGIYLTQRWLPSKRLTLQPTTWDSYRRNIDLHVLPHLGRVPLRHLRPDHLERLYANLLATGHTQRAGGLDNKTVLEAPSFHAGDAQSYVFARPDGAPIHPHLLSDAFKKLVRRSGMPRIRLHDLRHTHATLLLKSGVPIKVVSERLGHATPGFTMAT